MHQSRRSALCAIVGVVAMSTVTTACGGGKRNARGPEDGLEPWTGQLAELFNDQIHPAAVGLSMDGQSPARDPLLRLRTTNADVVSRMKVQTFDFYAVGAKTTYVLKLQMVPPAFAKPKLDDTQFELSIDQSSPVFGMVQNLGESMREMQFIGFVRKFPGEDGAVIHWHLTANTEEVAQVVHEAAVLDEIGGSER